MLILTRSITQTITIGDDISVTVLGVKGNQVRIGIDAPKSVSVHRSEIYDRIVNERRAENAIPGSVPNPTPAPKSDLYDQLVAKQGASDDERGSTIVKTTPAKTTTITVKKRRKVVL